jgi:hypothetical protein
MDLEHLLYSTETLLRHRPQTTCDTEWMEADMLAPGCPHQLDLVIDRGAGVRDVRFVTQGNVTCTHQHP